MNVLIRKVNHGVKINGMVNKLLLAGVLLWGSQAFGQDKTYSYKDSWGIRHETLRIREITAKFDNLIKYEVIIKDDLNLPQKVGFIREEDGREVYYRYNSLGLPEETVSRPSSQDLLTPSVNKFWNN